MFEAAFRVVFGAVLLYWVGLGLTGWEPPPVAEDAIMLRDAIFASGYLIPAVLVVYFLVGVSFLTNRFVPLGSTILFPVSLNILLFHSFVNPNPRSLSIAGALFIANSIMLYQHRSAFHELLRAQTTQRRDPGSEDA